MPAEASEIDVTFTVRLDPDELLLLDGLCSAAVQAEVDLFKRGRDVADRHGVPFAAGVFVARAERAALDKGRLTCVPVSMVRCPVTGKRAEAVAPKRATRGNPFRIPVERSFAGYDLDRGFVVMENHPRLGISHEGLEALRPVLAAELLPLRAQIPGRLTGRKPRFRREDVVRCPACGWEGREGLTGETDPRRAELRSCPSCGEWHGSGTRFEALPDRFEVAEAAGTDADAPA